VADDGTTIDAMGRGALRVQVTAGGRHVDLITCHLKSKLLEYGDGRFAPRDEGERARAAAYALFRRAAEAATVRREADRRLGGEGERRAVVVLGDLNDEPGAATSELLLGPPGSQIGSGGFDQPDRGDRWRLWNLAPLIPAERRFSRIFEGRRELIDQILVSRFLVERVASADTGGAVPSIGADPRARRDAPASDHAPVVARFEL
jgi:endonuclease/exonuclease/phosphatase family metal-dependent hydrolase